MEVFVEGQENLSENAILPQFNIISKKSHFFEIYNKGTQNFNWKASTSNKWIQLSTTKGTIATQERIVVTIDWNKVPSKELLEGEIVISGPSAKRKIKVSVSNPEQNSSNKWNNLFVEEDGEISINPTDFNKKVEKGNIKFQKNNGLGYSNSALQLGNAKYDSGENSYVEYEFYASKATKAIINTYMLPLFAKDKSHSTRYAIQIDNENLITLANDVKEYSNEWAANVIRNSAINQTTVQINKEGKHTLRIYAVDPGMIIQKIVIDFGTRKKSYIGAPTQKKD